MGLDFDKMFAGLTKTIEKATEDADSDAGDNSADGDKDSKVNKDKDDAGDKGAGDSDLAKSVEELGADVATIAKFLSSDEPTGLKGILKSMVDTQNTHGDVLEKVMDRLETIESRGAIRKSVSADSGDDDSGEDNRTEEQIQKAAGNELNAAMARIGKAAYNGGRGSLTLVG